MSGYRLSAERVAEIEEVGEVCRAALDGSPTWLEYEVVDAIAVLLRVCEEGDGSVNDYFAARDGEERCENGI